MKKISTFLATAAIGLGLAAPASAATYNLTDLNSSLSFDDSSGFYLWSVDGVNHLYQEQYFARVGAGAGVALSPASVVVAGFNMTMTYNLSGWGTILMVHTLLGGNAGSDQASWSTSIAFRPITGAPDLNFFVYDDFDVGQTDGGDTVDNTAAGIYIQTDPLSPGQLNRWTAAIAPTYCQAGFYGVTGPNINGNLTGTNGNCDLGVGDVWFANQWLNPTNFSIDRSINPAPEPGSLALLGLGLLGLGLARRRA